MKEQQYWHWKLQGERMNSYSNTELQFINCLDEENSLYMCYAIKQLIQVAQAKRNFRQYQRKNIFEYIKLIKALSSFYCQFKK